MNLKLTSANDTSKNTYKYKIWDDEYEIECN